MEFSNTYNGAVFFVDLLGIGALTQNKIDIASNFNEDELLYLDIIKNESFYELIGEVLK